MDMINLLKKTKNKIFHLNPLIIKYCIFPSNFCDYTHLKLSKNRPHAGLDRGVFKEDMNGHIKINNLKWDHRPGVLFTQIFEYIALENHYLGKENWKNSKFAQRCVKYIKLNNQIRGFYDHKSFLLKREKQIDNLFLSIQKNGVYPNNVPREKNIFVDNISVALTGKSKLYFNNRGHHRLSIAKILKLKEIPVKITVAKSLNILSKFCSSYDN
jgi:hypothetical protein